MVHWKFRVTKSARAASISFLSVLVGVILTADQSTKADVFTDPVGFITLNIKGTNSTSVGSAGALSFQGLGMTQLVEFQGKISAIGTDSITDNNAVWADDEFNGPNGPHFIEITSGALAGTIIDISDTDDAGNSLTLAAAGDLTATALAVDDTYRINKHWTLASVFGANNESGLQGGETANGADNILILDPSTGLFDSYFYKNTGLGSPGWKKDGASPFINQANTILYIDRGVLVKRKAGDNLEVKLLGQVKLGKTLIPAEENLNISANVYPAILTLAGSGLHTGNDATGFHGGETAAQSDQVLIFNPSTQLFDVYFFKTTGLGSPGWKKDGASPFIDAGNTAIEIGTSVVIKRLAGFGPFDWSIEQPF